MADSMLSVRVSEETRDRFNALFGEYEGGEQKSKREFIDTLLEQFELQETGKKVPTLQAAITAVNDMATKTSRIIAGVSEIVTANEDKARERMENITQNAKDKVNEAEKKVIEITEENAKLKTEYETMVKMVADARDEKEQLESMHSDRAALLDEYRDKIRIHEEQSCIQQEIVSKAEKTLEELVELRETSGKQALEIKQLQVLVSQVEVEREKALVDMRDEHSQALSSLQDAKQQAISEYQKESQQAISDYRGLLGQVEEKEVKHSQEIKNMQETQRQAIVKLQSKHEKDLIELQQDYKGQIEEKEKAHNELRQTIEKLQEDLKTAQTELEKLKKTKPTTTRKPRAKKTPVAEAAAALESDSK